MNAQTNSMNVNGGPASYLLGTGLIAQVLLAIVLATLLYIGLMAFEIVYKSFTQVSGTRVDILPMTVTSDKPREFIQDPSTKGSVTLPLSDNERTGAEFSYSFFLWIKNNNFNNDQALKTIFHKGYANPFPLMGPGVFLRTDINTLRIYMNTSKSWNRYVEVENMPINKWIHVTLVARNNALEVFVNGNLAQKLTLQDETFYQNFGNLRLFSQRTNQVNPSMMLSAGSSDSNSIMRVQGPMDGYLSNLFYFSYALSYTELQALLNQGPSSRTETNAMDAPPYLQDNWWVNNYSS
jgi:hypothetical protein